MTTGSSSSVLKLLAAQTRNTLMGLVETNATDFLEIDIQWLYGKNQFKFLPILSKFI